jgi:geranylgeranyl diphosphate synthase type I
MASFDMQLQQYKQRVEADIAVYSAHVQETTRQQFGKYPSVVIDSFLDMLGRGGKRLRGALVMAGYEMVGGTDRTMIVRAATAVEMMHAYLLILDDILDRSDTRRGKPTVHKMLEAYHTEQGMRGDAAHTGISLAINAAVSGGYASEMIIAGLNVEPELRSKAQAIIAQAILTTAHGQTLDFVQEITDDVTMESIEQTMEWKTAFYTFLNPLCVGMVLAGAGCEDTDAIRDYALHAGKAFQITDDIIGIFGSDQKTGKNAMDDIREGKQTLLTVYAAEHAASADAAMLQKCLGDAKLTAADFEACKRVMNDSGALAHAEAEARKHTQQALTALDKAPATWKPAQVRFLRELAEQLVHRAS